MSATTIWPYAAYFFRPYRALLALTLVAMMLAAGLETLTIGLLMPFLSTAMNGVRVPAGARALRALTSLIDWLPVGDQLTRTVVAIALAAVAAEVAKFATTMLMSHLASTARRDVGVKTYQHLLDSSVVRVIERPQGEWINTVVTAAFQMTSLFTLSPLLVIQALRTVCGLALLLLISVKLTLVGAAVGLVFYAFTTYMGRRHLFRLGAGQVSATAVQNTVINEAITGIREIKIYDRVEQWTQKFRAATSAYTSQAIRQATLHLLPENLLGLALVAIVCAGLIFLHIATGPASVTWVPVVAVFVAGFGRVSSELASLGKYRMQIVGMLPFAETVKRELETPLARHVGGRPLTGVPQAIEFRNVAYTHRGRDHTLEGVSFTVQRGQMVAIVGASGAGKSTVIDLLLALYDPARGAIFIDGEDLRTLDRRLWHAQIGYVGQEGFLFHASVRDNIAIGRAATEQELLAAAAVMRVDPIVDRDSSDGGSAIGDRGTKLSGGERQRIALARAFLKRPAIMILDEATNSLESTMEIALVRDLRAVTSDGFMFLVTHRLGPAVDADLVVVLEEGRVAEIGTHDSLLQNRATYHRLWHGRSDER